MILTCDLSNSFTEEDFEKVVTAFDYNNEIYQFDINLRGSNSYFYPQLNSTNLGRLNITYFSLDLNLNGRIQQSLIGEGAFTGSVGSIRNITVENINSYSEGMIELHSHVLHPACETL